MDKSRRKGFIYSLFFFGLEPKKEATKSWILTINISKHKNRCYKFLHLKAYLLLSILPANEI